MNRKDWKSPEDLKDLKGKEGQDGKQGSFTDKDWEGEDKDDKEEGKWKESDKNNDIQNTILKELKELKEYKEKAEKEKLELERKALIDQGKLEEAYKMDVKAKEEALSAKDKELRELRVWLKMKESWLSDKFKKFITGTTDEEIEREIKELKEEFGIQTKEDVKDKIPWWNKEVDKEGKDKKRVFTLWEIGKMTTEEYKKNKEEIDKQLKAWLIK